jgi:hypothetical protein
MVLQDADCAAGKKRPIGGMTGRSRTVHDNCPSPRKRFVKTLTIRLRGNVPDMATRIDCQVTTAALANHIPLTWRRLNLLTRNRDSKRSPFSEY